MIDAYDIECALEALFLGDSSEKKFKAIDVQRGITALTRPGLTWAVTGGKFSVENGMAEDTYEAFDIVALLVVKNVASEKERRRDAHAAIRYIVLKLMDSSLALDIEDLVPVKWREITDAEQLQSGLLVMELTFTTRALVVPEQSGEALRRLESIWTTYTDPADGQPLAESQANFEHGETP